MAAVQSSQIESLEVRESGRALKVQTDNPHLVSIGSGRLSTNVTWHPLPEGKVTLGTSPDVDIVLQGTGVQPKHCVIENNENVVTLYPIAEMTTVDGVRVNSATRLCQGNMLCIGRSNYLRFNHPAEANLMKKYLPNTRISMASPLNFFGNGDGYYDKKPPMGPTKRTHDSWGELSNGSHEELAIIGSKGSKFELFSPGQAKSISPKVFPPGSATVNSPASVVLGHSRIPNGLLASSDTKTKNNSVSVSGVTENGNVDYIEPHVSHTISSYPQKATLSSVAQPQRHVSNGFISPDTEADKIHSPRVLMLPSPAFNRNPSPYVPDKFRSITPNMFPAHATPPALSPRSLSASFGIIGGNSDEDSERLLSRSQDVGHLSNFGGEEQLQAQNDHRVSEQKAQMLEKQRLDEILNMCAEYERQIQSERQTKVPTTPTLHQNRIKTNGSLPRDKRNNGLPSPLSGTSDDELNQIFTFDTSKSPAKTRNCLYDNVRVVNNVFQFENPESTSKSPYENLSKPENQDHYDVSSVVNRHVYIENNSLAISPHAGEKAMTPQSPRTRIRTTVRDQACNEHGNATKQLPGFDDYDTADPIKFRDPSPNVNQRQYLTPSQQLNKFNNLSGLMSPSGEHNENQGKFILPLDHDQETKDLSDLMVALEKEFTATLTELNESDKNTEITSKGDSWINDDLPESDRDIHIVNNGHDNTKETDDKPKSFLREKKTGMDWGKLKVEKSTWLGIVTRLKSDINNLEQQEEEVLRELKMEMALLNAEYVSQKEKQTTEEEKLNNLKEKQKQLDAEIEECKVRHTEVQKNCNERIQELKKELQDLEKSLGDEKDSSEEYKNLLDKLEAEKKSFEDIEFKQLEEEAHWLASKDELQRDIVETAGRLETRKVMLSELECQVRDIEKSSQNESNALEQQKIKLQQQLEAARIKMKDLDIRLSAESTFDVSSTEEGSICLKDNQRSKRSEEDLVRISKVTSNAPIDVGKTGSLGRKTIESLKEIERNRQLHLAKQGSQVIEEERKRVEQLKRRVQDEVRAQWEQSRQRECNSLNSVGSEESNMTCSDQPTESASSDDIEKTLPGVILADDTRSSAGSYDKLHFVRAVCSDLDFLESSSMVHTCFTKLSVSYINPSIVL
ncbi:hypothetical protein RUM43_008625 [Polyplax serrata]|uniref:FHA domain-containing protein n=1 Tax=Polyplax serrata TaxID=468196 RepID=A0AAN8NUL2_POLSC